MSSVPGLPSVRQILSIYGLKAKKQLSQNFLLNDKHQKKIAGYLQGPLADNLVIEIGPGPGGLTRQILTLGPRSMVVIEKDERFLPSLMQLKDSFPALNVVKGDALEVLRSSHIDTLVPDPLFKRLQVIGNLPFGVASPLLILLLESVSKRAPPSPSKLSQFPECEFVLMFQKEVAERIVARPGSSSRNKFSALVQHYCEVELCTIVPRNWFTPAPKVDAAVVRLVRKNSPTLDFCLFRESLDELFRYPRKMVKRAIDPCAEFLSACPDFPLLARPAELTDVQITGYASWLRAMRNKLREETPIDSF